MGKGGGRGAKSRVLCEVCGRRVRRGRIINVSIPGSARKRLIHDDPSCKRKWEAEKTTIMGRWVEARKLEHPMLLKGVNVPKKRSREPFIFPPEAAQWVRMMLQRETKRVKGDIKKWLVFLQKDKPTWVPKTSENDADYQEFYRFVASQEAHLKWEKEAALLVSASPAVTLAAEPSAVPEPAVPPSVSAPPQAPSDVPELVDANIAIIRLLGKQEDRETLLAILAMMLGHITEKPKLPK